MQVQCGGQYLATFPQHPDIPYLSLPAGTSEDINYLNPIRVPGWTAEQSLSYEDLVLLSNGGYLDPLEYGVPCGYVAPEGETPNPVPLTRQGWQVYLCPYPSVEYPSTRTDWVGRAKIYWPQVYGPRHYTTADSVYPCSWVGSPASSPYTSNRINREWWQYRDDDPSPTITVKGGCDDGACFSYIYIKMVVLGRFDPNTHALYDDFGAFLQSNFVSLHITYNLPVEIVGPTPNELPYNQYAYSYIFGASGYPVAMDGLTHMDTTYNFANDPTYIASMPGLTIDPNGYWIRHNGTKYINQSDFPLETSGDYAFLGAGVLNGQYEIPHETNISLSPHYLW